MNVRTAVVIRVKIEVAQSADDVVRTNGDAERAEGKGYRLQRMMIDTTSA
jgi:hypothetical protein